MGTQKNNLTNFPKLMSEWDYELNNISPEDVTAGSGKKRWWKCKDGHSWESVVGNRVQGRGCPYCSGQKISPENCLASTHPELLSDWDYELNNISPQDVSSGSGRRPWWKCKDGHSWQTAIINRTKKKTGCPYCSNYYVSDTNSLQSLSSDLSQEWHPTKNGTLTPSDVVAGSAKTVWWKCTRGHEWKTTLNSRFSGGSNCPKCSNQSSKGEMRILSELNFLFYGLKSRIKKGGYEIDIFIPSLNVGIEFDGLYYHGGNSSKDVKKNKKLEEIGIPLIRVREPGMLRISENDLLLSKKSPSKQEINILLQILSKFGEIIGLKNYLEKDEFVNEELYLVYIESFPNPLPGNSISETHPESNKYWDFEKNNPLTPVNFSHGSDYRAWWKCENGHSTQVNISSKIKKFSSCGVCSNKITKSFEYTNSLEHTSPEIANLWHPTKNGDLTPDKISNGSHKKVWFKCTNSHEWSARLYSVKNTKCAQCNSFDFKYPELLKFWDYKTNDIEPNKIGFQSAQKIHWICEYGHPFSRILNVVTRNENLGCPVCKSLQFARPHLVKEWDFKKNGDLKPSDFSYGSTRKVWWACPEGHSYQSSIGHRSDLKNPTGCPQCYFVDK